MLQNSDIYQNHFLFPKFAFKESYSYAKFKCLSIIIIMRGKRQKNITKYDELLLLNTYKLSEIRSSFNVADGTVEITGGVSVIVWIL